MFSIMGLLQKPGVQVRTVAPVLPQAVFFPLPEEDEISSLSIHRKWPLLSRTFRIKLWQITQLLVCSFMRNGVHNSKISIVVLLLWGNQVTLLQPPWSHLYPRLRQPFLNLSSQGTAPALTSLGAPHWTYTSLSTFCIEGALKPDTVSGHGLIKAEQRGLIQSLDAWMDHVQCLPASDAPGYQQSFSHRVSPQSSHPPPPPLQGFSFRGPGVCIDPPWISQDYCWLTPPAWLGPDVESCVVVAPEMILLILYMTWNPFSTFLKAAPEPDDFLKWSWQAVAERQARPFPTEVQWLCFWFILLFCKWHILKLKK